MHKLDTLFLRSLLAFALCCMCSLPVSAQDIAAAWTQDTWASNADIVVLEEFDGRIFAGISNTGLFYSDDNGDSWRSLIDKLPMQRIFCLLKTDMALYVGGLNGIFRSIDKGESWLPLRTESGEALPLIIDMAQLGSTIIAANSSALYTSDELSEAWQKLELAENETLNAVNYIETHNDLLYLEENGMTHSLDILQDLESRRLQRVNTEAHISSMLKTVDGSLYNADHYSSAGRIIFRLNDADQSWQDISNNIPHGTVVYDLVASQDRHYIASSNGVFESKDARNWQSIHTNSPAFACKRLTLADGYLLIGAFASGVHRFEPGSPSADITPVNLGLNSWEPLQVWQSEHMVFAQHISSGSLTKERGTSDEWTDLQTDNENAQSLTISDIVESEGQLHMLAGSLYNSTDGGRTWQVRDPRVLHSLGEKKLIAAGADVFGFEDSRTVYIRADNSIEYLRTPEDIDFTSAVAQNGAIFGAAIDGRVFQSTDQARSWLDIGTGLHNSPILNMWADDERILGVTSTSLLESRDAGGTWTEINIDALGEGGPLLDVTVEQGTIYLLQDRGIWFQRSTSDDWTALSLEGLPPEFILSAMSIRNDRIYVGGNGGSIFTTTLQRRASSVAEVSVNIHDLQFSPNPVKQNSSMTFTLAQASDIEISIYDLLGNSVHKPMRSFRSAGSFTQDINTRGLTSGQYILVIRAGAETLSQQFSVLR